MIPEIVQSARSLEITLGLPVKAHASQAIHQSRGKPKNAGTPFQFYHPQRGLFARIWDEKYFCEHFYV